MARSIAEIEHSTVRKVSKRLIFPMKFTVSVQVFSLSVIFCWKYRAVL